MSTEPQSNLETEQLRRRNRELAILHSIAEALNHQVDLTRALQTVLDQVGALFDLTTGWVWLIHDKTGESYLAASRNLPPGLAEDPQLMEGDCYCLRTYREGDLEGAANVNVVRCSRLNGLISGTAGLRHHARSNPVHPNLPMGETGFICQVLSWLLPPPPIQYFPHLYRQGVRHVGFRQKFGSGGQEGEIGPRFSNIARGEQHLDVGVIGVELLRQFRATHLGHHHIGYQEFDTLTTLVLDHAAGLLRRWPSPRPGSPGPAAPWPLPSTPLAHLLPAVPSPFPGA